MSDTLEIWTNDAEAFAIGLSQLGRYSTALNANPGLDLSDSIRAND